MNILRSKSVRLGLVALLGLGMTLASNSGADAATAAKTNPTVSAKPGVEPVIGKPTGAAPSVLIKKDIFLGKGKVALSSSTIKAQYVLVSWKTGKVLQSSWSSGPFTSPLAGVIVGWQQGIPGMKVGGRRLLVIPGSLAYGAAGAGAGSGIGPNETLVFVVDLLGVN